jgi:hypothetical protein
VTLNKIGASGLLRRLIRFNKILDWSFFHLVWRLNKIVERLEAFGGSNRGLNKIVERLDALGGLNWGFNKI